MVSPSAVSRGDVVLVALEPAVGGVIRKTRPCTVVSPDDLNRHLQTFIVAPMTTGGRAYPFRIPCRFQGKNGFLVLDQVRTIDRSRVVRRLGSLSRQTTAQVLKALQEMFAS